MVSLFFNPNTNRIPELRVPTCDACKKPSTRFAFPHLSPLPEEIVSVPLHKRRYLSPVFLHSFLRRTPNSNPYSKYRSLTGQMNYSHNIKAHTLYSGALEAFLESNKDRDPSDQDRHSSHDDTLRRAASWLSENNPYLRPFANFLSSNRDHQALNDPFPTARHVQIDAITLPVNPRESWSSCSKPWFP